MFFFFFKEKTPTLHKDFISIKLFSKKSKIIIETEIKTNKNKKKKTLTSLLNIQIEI